MKKPFISPKLDIIHIKNGDVIMNSHGGVSCIGDLFCNDDSHSCENYQPPGT